MSLVSEAHRRHWQQRRRQEAERIAVRREQAERKAEAAAKLLKQHWPQIQAVWLFGSVLEPGFGLRSDLDLCVEGLPADALFAAMHQLDQLQQDVADPELLIPVDLVRLEALPEHWQKRIRERARIVASMIQLPSDRELHDLREEPESRAFEVGCACGELGGSSR